MKQADRSIEKEKKCRRHWEEEGWRLLYIQSPHRHNDRHDPRSPTNKTKPDTRHTHKQDKQAHWGHKNKPFRPKRAREKTNYILFHHSTGTRLLSDNQFATVQFHHDSLSLHRDISRPVNKRIDVEGEHLGGGDSENTTVGVVVLLG